MNVLVSSSKEEEVIDETTSCLKVTVETEWGFQTSKVVVNTKDLTVHCSCKKFESMGILCTHSLAALKAKDITKIPDSYLLKRWGQNARKRVSDVDQSRIFSMQGTDSTMVFTNQAMKFAYTVVNKSASHEAGRLIFWKGLESINQQLDESLKSLTLKDSQSEFRDDITLDNDLACKDGNEFPIPIQDPNRIRKKGRERGERLKGHFEKRQRGSSLKGGHSQGIYFYF
jgi:hypothetical protein